MSSSPHLAFAALFLIACGSGTAKTTRPSAAKSVPASSTCNHFDPTGTWTVESDAHDRLTVSLTSDDNVARTSEGIGWTWEADTPPPSGCVVRFYLEERGAGCEFAVVAQQTAVSGFVSCCELDTDERPTCLDGPVTGAVVLRQESDSPP